MADESRFEVSRATFRYSITNCYCGTDESFTKDTRIATESYLDMEEILT